MSDRKKPSWVILGTAVLLIVLIGYPLSYGPACRIVLSEPLVNVLPVEFFLVVWAIYHPIDVAYKFAPEPIQNVYDAYFEWSSGYPTSEILGA